jgi:hypothetical protein
MIWPFVNVSPQYRIYSEEATIYEHYILPSFSEFCDAGILRELLQKSFVHKIRCKHWYWLAVEE